MTLFWLNKLCEWRLFGGEKSDFLPLVSGHARGRENGIPTLNAEDPHWPQAQGVYLVQLHVSGLPPYWAMLHYGPRLSYGIEKVNVEAHVLEWDSRLEKALSTENPKFSISFFLYIRENRRFESTDALVANIRNDMIEAALYLFYCEIFFTQHFAR